MEQRNYDVETSYIVLRTTPRYILSICSLNFYVFFRKCCTDYVSKISRIFEIQDFFILANILQFLHSGQASSATFKILKMYTTSLFGIVLKFIGKVIGTIVYLVEISCLKISLF